MRDNIRVYVQAFTLPRGKYYQDVHWFDIKAKSFEDACSKLINEKYKYTIVNYNKINNSIDIKVGDKLVCGLKLFENYGDAIKLRNETMVGYNSYESGMPIHYGRGIIDEIIAKGLNVTYVYNEEGSKSFGRGYGGTNIKESRGISKAQAIDKYLTEFPYVNIDDLRFE